MKKQDMKQTNESKRKQTSSPPGTEFTTLLIGQVTNLGDKKVKSVRTLMKKPKPQNNNQPETTNNIRKVH